MTQAMLKRLDGYEAHCEAMKTTTGRYAPIYKLFKGTVTSGVLIHQQDYPAPGDDYDTESEAFHAAADQAVAWLEVNRAT